MHPHASLPPPRAGPGQGQGKTIERNNLRKALAQVRADKGGLDGFSPVKTSFI